ncbi:MAG TPA: hypothetical protein VID04_01530 [Methylomirabilota bacterium]|jgi:hypothetical protein
MKTLVVLLALALALPASALGGDPVTRTFNAPKDKVWSVTQAVLKTMDWDIDKEDQPTGLMVTESRKIDGEDWGVYEKSVRHRMQLHVKDVGGNKTTVTIERSVFERERKVFVNEDKPIPAKDQTVEKAVLDAIAKSL